jgi:restriction system protein
MQTIYEISEEKSHALTQAEPPGVGNSAALEEAVRDQTEFVLERYLEDFIVSNFEVIFRGRLVLYADPREGLLGQQFSTDVGVIDILAQEPKSGAFVVIELKKGRESDKVVGQVLRYMGWVAENLCQQGQDVRGMIICKKPDPRLSYALSMVKNVSVKYYRVDFKLQDQF